MLFRRRGPSCCRVRCLLHCVCLSSMGWVQAWSELTVDGTIFWIIVGLQFNRRLAWSMVAQYDKEEQLLHQSIVQRYILWLEF